MKKTYCVTFSISGGMTIEAENEEEARELAENMSSEEILDYVKDILKYSDGYEVGDVIDAEECGI